LGVSTHGSEGAQARDCGLGADRPVFGAGQAEKRKKSKGQGRKQQERKGAQAKTRDLLTKCISGVGPPGILTCNEDSRKKTFFLLESYPEDRGEPGGEGGDI